MSGTNRQSLIDSFLNSSRQIGEPAPHVLNNIEGKKLLDVEILKTFQSLMLSIAGSILSRKGVWAAVPASTLIDNEHHLPHVVICIAPQKRERDTALIELSKLIRKARGTLDVDCFYEYEMDEVRKKGQEEPKNQLTTVFLPEDLYKTLRIVVSDDGLSNPANVALLNELSHLFDRTTGIRMGCRLN